MVLLNNNNNNNNIKCSKIFSYTYTYNYIHFMVINYGIALTEKNAIQRWRGAAC